MNEKILEIIVLANSVNEKNKKLYTHIEYDADARKKLSISIIDKETYTIIENLKVNLTNNNYSYWKTIIDTINCYAGGAENE